MIRRILSVLVFITLLTGCTANKNNAVELRTSQGKLTIESEGRELLTYNHREVSPPDGVDPLYAKSGFIHPLKTPSGHVLTRIQPESHYHHYGLWSAWTHVAFEGDTVDLWNLIKDEGKVRFRNYTALIEEEKSAGYSARHEHIVNKAGEEKLALLEDQTVLVHTVSDSSYLLDIHFEYEVQESDFEILDYRYGGLGWRATEEWNEQNSYVLTSSGKDRSNADGSTEQWVLIQGELGSEKGGILLMSYPENQNHPESLRLWPEGDMFMTFFPTRTQNWKLEAGRLYHLRYRLVVFDGVFDREMADEYWDQFSKTQF